MAKLTEVIGKGFALKPIVKRVGDAQVSIKSYADVETFGNIVQAVAQTCFQGGVYRAENREIASRFVMLKYFTDIEVDEGDIEEIFKMTQGGTWFASISSIITKLPIWAEIDLAIDRQIDYMIATHVTATESFFADLSAMLGTDQTVNLADIKEVLNTLTEVELKPTTKKKKRDA